MSSKHPDALHRNRIGLITRGRFESEAGHLDAAQHRTLGAHRRAMERVWAGEETNKPDRESQASADELTAGYGSDDERSLLPPDQQELEAAEALAAATRRATGSNTAADPVAEKRLLDDMAAIVDRLPSHRGLIDPQDVVDAHRRHDGDLREALYDLYDRFERRSR